MKNIFKIKIAQLFVLANLLIHTSAKAQAPQGFNYQAIIRNSAGALITNQIVGFKFSIKQTSASGTTVYSETQYVTPDNLGQVSLVVGTGSPSTTATFSAINWASGTYYLAIELNTGAGFVAMGTTQLLSVPYALYANSAGNSQATTPNLASVLAVNNGANNLQIKNLANPTDNQDAVTKSYVDALNNNSSLMKFNGWDNYQIWNDNTTFQLQPNSFLFINANNTTLIFPNNTSNFGDVIYVYVMQKELPIVNLRANGPALIAVPDNSAPNDLYSTSSGIITGKFKGGLNTIVHVGDYWMVGDFEKAGIFSSVTIGTQIWSSTNLDVTTYRDGTPIPQVTDPTQWANLTTGAWCYYNNTTANSTTYGKLYNWYAVAGIHDTDPNTPNKILAPIGWHIPTDNEWTTQTTFLGGEQVAGGKMKATGISQWLTPNTGATNESGFTALPGGYRHFGQGFLGINSGGNWWSSSEINTTNAAWSRYLFNNTGNVYRYDSGYKANGFSVRCIKD